MSKKIQHIIEQLPSKPGVYKFYNRAGQILYIGKAINLRSRVRSYFSNKLIDRPWVRQMIPHISDIKVIEAENEVEALILESNLIKKHLPKYNIASKDDRKYAWIEVEQRVPFPRVKKTRDFSGKGRYYGPYPDGGAVNHVLKYIRTIYPFRSCNLDMYLDRSPNAVKKPRVCIYYHLNLCPGPCDNLITAKEYCENIKHITKTLEGKKRSHIRELEKTMMALAERKKYEEAARIRDKVRDLSYLSQRIDIHYGDAEDEFHEIQKNRFEAGIKEIAAALKIALPHEKIKKTRVECYDISNLANEITYGSMAVAEGSSVVPSQYRIFKFKENIRRDDPEMLRRVIIRRLKHISREISPDLSPDESLSKIPTFILLDGAQAQLSAVRPVIPKNIGIFAISKGKHFKRKGMPQNDEFWIISSSDKPKRITLENPFLFQHLRDEAHRFAIKHMRQGKRFLQKRSVLDEITGIGPKRRKLLFMRYGTVDEIKKASRESLEKTLQNKTAAKEVYAFFHTKK